MLLDFCKGKFDSLVSVARQAIHDCIGIAGKARLRFSSLFGISRSLPDTSDVSVVKRLKQMKTGLQQKESKSAVDPFRQTFLERAREYSSGSFEVNRPYIVKKKLQMFADSHWCLKEVDSVVESCLKVAPGRSLIGDKSIVSELHSLARSGEQKQFFLEEFAPGIQAEVQLTVAEQIEIERTERDPIILGAAPTNSMPIVLGTSAVQGMASVMPNLAEAELTSSFESEFHQSPIELSFAPSSIELFSDPVELAPLELDTEPATLELHTEPASLELDTEPASLELDTEPASLELDTEPASLELDTEPASLELDTEPAQQEYKVGPAPIEFDTEPTPTEFKEEPGVQIDFSTTELSLLIDVSKEELLSVESTVSVPFEYSTDIVSADPVSADLPSSEIKMDPELLELFKQLVSLDLQTRSAEPIEPSAELEPMQFLTEDPLSIEQSGALECELASIQSSIESSIEPALSFEPGNENSTIEFSVEAHSFEPLAAEFENVEVSITEPIEYASNVRPFIRTPEPVWIDLHYATKYKSFRKAEQNQLQQEKESSVCLEAGEISFGSSNQSFSYNWKTDFSELFHGLQSSKDANSTLLRTNHSDRSDDINANDCLDLLLAELNQPMSELPSFDANGNLIRCA